MPLLLVGCASPLAPGSSSNNPGSSKDPVNSNSQKSSSIPQSSSSLVPHEQLGNTITLITGTLALDVMKRVVVPLIRWANSKTLIWAHF